MLKDKSDNLGKLSITKIAMQMLLRLVEARDAEPADSLQHHQKASCQHDVHVLAVADLIGTGGTYVAFWEASRMHWTLLKNDCKQVIE